MSGVTTPAAADCPSPYIESCTLPSETTTTVVVARELPETGTDGTQTMAFAGAILVVVGLIAAIAGRRRATA